MKPALFLDRDGVINENYGYVHQKGDFDFIPGIFELVTCAKSAGYLTIVVTNQAGIGRGLYSLEQFRDLSTWMCERFKASGASIDAIYYSPFHPTEGLGRFLLKEDTRKPAAGMFFEAFRDFNISLSGSIMVGDKITDMEASFAAGITQNYLLTSSHQKKEFEPFDYIKIISELSEVISELKN
ncbi:HAD family hydrolase [Planktomarina temperata]|nr:HAD family hydrolase [Planktomarina temperata]